MTGVTVSAAENGAPNGAHPTDAEPGSALAQLRSAAAAQRKTRRKDLPVGGEFGSQLVIRYQVLAPEELDRFTDGAAGGTLRVSTFGVEIMVAACETLLWEGTDLGVGLGPELWQLMDWPLPPETEAEDLLPREVVLALFGGNGVALLDHASALMEWMRASEEPPGESSAASS